MQNIDPNHPKIIVVTGATSGIGEATVLELVKESSVLILPVRNLAKGQVLKKELLDRNPYCAIDIIECDFESIDSTRDCTKQILSKYKCVDILINNAGIMESNFRLTKDQIEVHFEVNVLSQYILITELLPLLQNSHHARVINLSSDLHSRGKFQIETITEESKGLLGGIDMYSNSNLYRNMLTFYFAKEFSGTKITFNCLHPGIIKTNLNQASDNRLWKTLKRVFDLFSKSPTDGAQTTVFLALAPEVFQVTGEYWSDCKIKEASDLSRDEQLAHQLIQECQRLSGV